MSAPDEREDGVNNHMLKLIDKAVFEVVVKKPFDSPDTIELKKSENREHEIIEDTYTYEKDLPWELVNYADRTDEYISIGTAFAISETQLMTAAHVLSLHSKTLAEDYYIRNKDGQVYELNDIIKHANNRDFTIFTVNGLDNMKHFELEYDYELNTGVFTVGNAHGEGVILRDGLLTSTTKETENGEWDYLRFSAAASPGNSGGPLLNRNGKVLGVILKKSENENLNYALPIAEAFNGDENKAVHHFFGHYALSITPRKYGPVKSTDRIDLPLHYKELKEKLALIFENSNKESISKLYEENKEIMYPFGEGSLRLLNNTNSFQYPYIAAENKDDALWNAFKPNDIESARLSNNGFISYGKMAEFTMIQFRKPLDVTVESLMNDSEYFIETFLKAYPLNRYFGSQAVRITSLGEASEVTDFTDRYKRTWYVQTWNIDFADSKLKIYAMPVPSGFIALSLLSTSGEVDQVQTQDLQEYLNYVFYSYGGTFSEWKEYLTLDYPTPPAFEGLEFSYTPGESLTFANSSFRFEYEEDLLSIEDKSNLVLRTAYAFKNGSPVWAPVGITFTNNFTGDNYIKLIKKIRPDGSLPEGYHQTWKNLVNEEFPFNQTVTKDDQLNYTDALHRQYSDSDSSNADFLYFVEVGKEGTIEESEMMNSLKLLQESITILE